MVDSTNHIKGMVFCLLAYLFYTMSDGIRKYLSEEYELFLIVFWAAFVSASSLLLIAAFKGGIKKNLATPQPLAHVIRASFIAICAVCTIYSFKYLPMADVNVIILMFPVVTIILSAIFFAEKITIFKIIAVSFGIVGTLLVIKPGFVEWHMGYLTAMIDAVLFAIAGMMFKSMGKGESSISIAFYPNLLLILIAAIILGTNIYIPELKDVYLFIAAGIIYVSGIITLAKGYLQIEASEAALYGYSMIIWAIIFGIFVFDDIPDLYSMIGAAFIFGSGLLIYRGKNKQ